MAGLLGNLVGGYQLPGEELPSPQPRPLLSRGKAVLHGGGACGLICSLAHGQRQADLSSFLQMPIRYLKRGGETGCGGHSTHGHAPGKCLRSPGVNLANCFPGDVPAACPVLLALQDPRWDTHIGFTVSTQRS